MALSVFESMAWALFRNSVQILRLEDDSSVQAALNAIVADYNTIGRTSHIWESSAHHITVLYAFLTKTKETEVIGDATETRCYKFLITLIYVLRACDKLAEGIRRLARAANQSSAFVDKPLSFYQNAVYNAVQSSTTVGNNFENESNFLYCIPQYRYYVDGVRELFTIMNDMANKLEIDLANTPVLSQEYFDNFRNSMARLKLSEIGNEIYRTLKALYAVYDSGINRARENERITIGQSENVLNLSNTVQDLLASTYERPATTLQSTPVRKAITLPARTPNVPVFRPNNNLALLSENTSQKQTIQRLENQLDILQQTANVAKETSTSDIEILNKTLQTVNNELQECKNTLQETNINYTILTNNYNKLNDEYQKQADRLQRIDSLPLRVEDIEYYMSLILPYETMVKDLKNISKENYVIDFSYLDTTVGVNDTNATVAPICSVIFTDLLNKLHAPTLSNLYSQFYDIWRYRKEFFALQLNLRYIMQDVGIWRACQRALFVQGNMRYLEILGLYIENAKEFKSPQEFKEEAQLILINANLAEARFQSLILRTNIIQTQEDLNNLMLIFALHFEDTKPPDNIPNVWGVWFKAILASKQNTTNIDNDTNTELNQVRADYQKLLVNFTTIQQDHSATVLQLETTLNNYANLEHDLQETKNELMRTKERIMELTTQSELAASVIAGQEIQIENLTEDLKNLRNASTLVSNTCSDLWVGEEYEPQNSKFILRGKLRDNEIVFHRHSYETIQEAWFPQLRTMSVSQFTQGAFVLLILRELKMLHRLFRDDKMNAITYWDINVLKNEFQKLLHSSTKRQRQYDSDPVVLKRLTYSFNHNTALALTINAYNGTSDESQSIANDGGPVFAISLLHVTDEVRGLVETFPTIYLSIRDVRALRLEHITTNRITVGIALNLIYNAYAKQNSGAITYHYSLCETVGRNLYMRYKEFFDFVIRFKSSNRYTASPSVRTFSYIRSLFLFLSLSKYERRHLLPIFGDLENCDNTHRPSPLLNILNNENEENFLTNLNILFEGQINLCADDGTISLSTRLPVIQAPYNPKTHPMPFSTARDQLGENVPWPNVPLPVARVPTNNENDTYMNTEEGDEEL